MLRLCVKFDQGVVVLDRERLATKLAERCHQSSGSGMEGTNDIADTAMKKDIDDWCERVGVVQKVPIVKTTQPASKVLRAIQIKF